jgi:hypothetical protein
MLNFFWEKYPNCFYTPYPYKNDLLLGNTHIFLHIFFLCGARLFGCTRLTKQKRQIKQFFFNNPECSILYTCDDDDYRKKRKEELNEKTSVYTNFERKKHMRKRMLDENKFSVIKTNKKPRLNPFKSLYPRVN